MAIKVGDGVLRISTDSQYFCYGIVLFEESKGLWKIKFCDGSEDTYAREHVNYYRNAFKKMMKDVK